MSFILYHNSYIDNLDAVIIFTGALLVKNTSAHVLKKTYYGGGTVAVSLPGQPFHVTRSTLSDK